MMKRRFTTITTILAGVLASNTAFFATQTIATQEMQPTMQATDRYMIIDLAGIPLDQAQNNMDAQIPVDTQLTEDSSSLSEQNESEMSMELVDQSESSVSEETLPYYLSLSSVDTAKVAYFDKLDELESSLSQTDPDITGTLTYAVSDIHAGEPMISYLLDQYAGYDTYSAVEFCEAASLQQADESGMYRLLLQQEEGADVVHYSMSDGTLQKTAVDSYVNEYGAPAVSLDANTNHWLIVHLTPEVSTPNESSAAGENQEETDEAASQSLEGKVDEDTSETTSQDVAKADPTKPSKPSEKSSSESATKPTKPTTKAPETTKPASTKPAQTTKAPETAATVAPTAATTAPPTTSPAPTTTQTPTVTTTTAAQTTAPTTTAHTHNWVAVTKTVHHDAVTSQVWKEDSAAWDETVVTKAAWDEQVLSQEAYDEQVLVSEAYDEPVYGWSAVCNVCGYHFPLDATSDDIGYHEVVDPGCGGGWHDVLVQTGTTHHDAVYSTVHHDAVYTTVHHDAETTVVHHEATGHYETVVTQAAWDETVTTGYKCSGCGATK